MCANSSGDAALRKPITGIAGCCARAASGHVAAAPPRSVMNSRRFVCRESSILSGDGGSVMTVSPSRPEARRRFGSQTANELGAPVASSIPEQLRGREPASARKGYEDALVLRNRRRWLGRRSQRSAQRDDRTVAVALIDLAESGP